MKYTVDVEYWNPVSKIGNEWMHTTIHELEAKNISEADEIVRSRYSWTRFHIKGIWESDDEDGKDYGKRNKMVAMSVEDWTQAVLLLNAVQSHYEQECDSLETLSKECGGPLKDQDMEGNLAFMREQIGLCMKLKDAIKDAV